jgi:hypothetical protein
MKLTTTKSKSIVSGILIAASIAFTATTAMAATTAHKTAAATHVVHTRHVAAAKHRPTVRQQPSLAQFFGLFGLPIPVVVTAHAARGTVSSATAGYDPTFDSPSPAVEVDNSQSQAAIDASDQATQQMDQDIQDMNASNAAAEAQNDTANAATQEYLINNGM